MYQFDIGYLPRGEQNLRDIQRVFGMTDIEAIAKYRKDVLQWPVPGDPPGKRVIARHINEIALSIEQKARFLLRTCRKHGFTRGFVDDGEGTIDILGDMPERESIAHLTATDGCHLVVKTAGFTAAEVEKVAFFLIWDNYGDEVLADHTDNGAGHRIAQVFTERFAQD